MKPVVYSGTKNDQINEPEDKVYIDKLTSHIKHVLSSKERNNDDIKIHLL